MISLLLNFIIFISDIFLELINFIIEALLFSQYKIYSQKNFKSIYDHMTNISFNYEEGITLIFASSYLSKCVNPENPKCYFV